MKTIIVYFQFDSRFYYFSFPFYLFLNSLWQQFNIKALMLLCCNTALCTKFSSISDCFLFLQMQLWDLTAGKLLHDFKCHEGQVQSIDFHPHEFLLATGIFALSHLLKLCGHHCLQCLATVICYNGWNRWNDVPLNALGKEKPEYSGRSNLIVQTVTGFIIRIFV